MIDKLKGKLSQERRSGIAYIMREHNTAGALFLASQGFRAILAPRHWEDTGEDGYSFGFKMPSPIVQKFRDLYSA